MPDPAEVLAAVAEGVQEFVMGHYRTIWPVCDQHNRGLHVACPGGTPVWECLAGPTGGHVVRTIDPAALL